MMNYYMQLLSQLLKIPTGTRRGYTGISGVECMLQIYDIKHNNDCRVSLHMYGGESVLVLKKRKKLRILGYFISILWHRRC